MLNTQNIGFNVPIMLSVVEVQKTFGLSKQYVYQLAKSGAVKAIRCGNRFLLNADSVSQYLNNNTLGDNSAKSISGIRPLG
jgi:excisionase family DNA binding protein